MTTNWYTPLLSHLTEFANEQPLSFHVPGHANGAIYAKLEKHLLNTPEKDYIALLAQIGKLDVTELSHTDDLHQPEGIIAEAEALTAALYNAEQSFFLVGGSTAGNIALILSLCQYDDYIIVQRNVHKSIINGCKLAGVNVIFVAPQLETTTMLPIVPSLEVIKQALEQYPNAKAVFLTTPNYYGIAANLQPYAELIHQYQLPLLVDEAHGAHYGIAPYAPKSALAAGADGVVQSAHKTLPALTMGAFLHIQGPYMKTQMLRQQLSIIQSSSPSYTMMASLDIARATLQVYGAKWFLKTYESIQAFKSWLMKEQLCIQAVHLPIDSKFAQDPYRLLLQDNSKKLSGYELQKELEAHNVWVEMANDQFVVLVCHMEQTEQIVDKLKKAVKHISDQIQHSFKKMLHVLQSTVEQQAVSAPIRLFRSVSDANIEMVLLENSTGRQCAEMVVPYPPGIPLLYEGETIQTGHINQIEQYRQLQARFQGSASLTDGLIKVFKV